MADPSTGLRRLPATGNSQKRLSWSIRNIAARPAYYCSVQAIDTCYAGSAWSAEAIGHGLRYPGMSSLPPGMAGVTLTADNNATFATTDADGYYEVIVASGWSGTVTPSDTGHTFVPASRSYSNVVADAADQDFSASGFADIGASLRGMSGDLAWGDYDNDGDLDLAITGTDGNSRYSKIYRNDGGTFTDIGAGLIQVDSSSLAWGDYDNDGDLDLALAGHYYQPEDEVATKIYRNDNGTFTDIGASLVGVQMCKLAWGDYNNDGNLDLAVAGYAGTVFNGTTYVTKIYRSEGGGFVDIGAPLVGVSRCSLAWGDYDNDGDLDLALAGLADSGCMSRVYRNDGGTFTDTGSLLTGVYGCSLAWGDYDNDGDLDLAIAGSTGVSSGSPAVSNIYRNDQGAFIDIGAGLTGVAGSLAWGDFDNDGDLDLALAGSTASGYSSPSISRVYRNDGGAFTDIGGALLGLSSRSIAWGDYDGDGDLDLCIAGQYYDGSYRYASKIYRNDALAPANTAPSSPTGFAAGFNLNGLTLVWNASSDSETPVSGLSYNIRVGSTPGGCDVFSGAASASTGLRRLPAIGNAQKRLSWTISNIAAKPSYYCSVQAIDTAYAGSAWSAEAVVQGVKISGHVRTPAGLAGVSVTADNNATYTTTDAAGYYELIVPSGWSGTVTPAKAGYWFSPADRGYSNVASDQTDQDFAASTFVLSGAAPTGVGYGSLAWGDYDNDGDLDLAIAGRSSTFTGVSKIYRNDNGTFTDIGAPLTGVQYLQSCLGRLRQRW